MSVVKITTFGGEAPSVASLNLPANVARRAYNLNPRVEDFLPMQSDVVKATQVSQVAKGITFDVDGEFLYRFKIGPTGDALADDTLGWRTNGYPLSYALGQINDNRRERVYISSLDGTTEPRVADATGINKPLGVPAPAAIPVVTPTLGNEYSVDEDTVARKAIPQAVLAALKASTTEVAFGVTPTATPPTASTSGWINHASATAGGLTLTTNVGDWAFLTPMAGDVLVLPKYTYLLGTAFGGKKVTYAGQTYWATPVTMQGQGRTVNVATLTTAIKAIANPDPDVGGQLVPDANAAAYAQRLADYFSVTVAPQKALIDALSNATKAFIAADAADDATLYDPAMDAFYAQTDVAADLLKSYTAFANAMAVMQATLYPGSVNMTEASLITAVPVSYVKTFTDGHRELDYNKLSAYVGGMAYIGIEAENPGDTATQWAQKVRVIGFINPALDALQASIAPAHWASYTGWPQRSGATALTADQVRASQMLSAITAMRTNARQVTAAYDAALVSVLGLIEDVFDVDIAPYLPAPVTRLVESRYYLTTLVTTWGEESAPSPPTDLLTLDQSDTVTVARPAELANTSTVSTYKLAGWRVYRSNAGTSTTSAQLVGPGVTGWDAQEGYFPIGVTGVTDNLESANLQEVIPSITWLVPPVTVQPAGVSVSKPYLAGLCAMANGIMAGFNGQTVCFSEAYFPYAWPMEYQLTTKYDIVGLGAFGQTLFVGTTGSPVLISGADPSSLSILELQVNQACVSARSIASVDSGVLYASPDGICLVTLSGLRVVTEKLFTRDDWQAINPASIVGAMHNNIYYFLYNGRSVTSTLTSGAAWVGGATADNLKALFEGIKQLIWTGDELRARAIYKARQATYGFTDAAFAVFTPFTATEVGLWKNNLLLEDPHRVAGWGSRVTRASGCYGLDFSTGKLIEFDIQGSAFYVDITTDTLYVLDGTDIKALFVDTAVKRSGEYWTGVVKLGKPESLAWLQVDGDGAAPAVVDWYADGALRYSTTVKTKTPVRLPAGRYAEHQIRITSADRITSVTMASSTAELQQA